MEKVYCWIKDNKMFMASASPPNIDWCDRYIEVEVDKSKSFIYEYDEINDKVKVIYNN